MPDTTDWNARAATYDSLAWVHNQDLLDWTARLALNAIKPAVERTEVGRILEVGCGTGALTQRLVVPSKHTLKSWKTIAVDVSGEMLKKATARLWDHLDAVDFFEVEPAKGLPFGPYAAVVSRMVLHHAPFTPLGMLQAQAKYVAPGGVLVVAEGPPPSVDDRHDANHLYRAAMALKEPGRHVFHAHDVAEWMFQSGCVEVRVAERWTEGNSVRGWLSGGGIEPSRAEAILALHREASPSARALYRIEETPDGDVTMCWRHCVVTGIRG
jgi:SAM-dependent methyltransferase